MSKCVGRGQLCGEELTRPILLLNIRNVKSLATDS